MSGGLAIFRVEGSILHQRAASCAAWLAVRQRDILGRVARVAGIAASPLGRLLGAADVAMAQRAAWMALKGCSEDRLIVLGEDWLSTEAGRNEAGLRLVERCLAAGQRVVLLSDLPVQIIGPLQAELGAHDLWCNRLEIEDGHVTGRLADPVFTGRVDRAWIGRQAAAVGASGELAAAYAAFSEDGPTLAAVARPCAVTPDAGLRRLAREMDWPVVEA